MTQPKTTGRFRLKGFTSLLLTLSFVVLAFSGVMLYLSPYGRMAHWTDWTLVGLTKDQWSAVHMVAGFLFLIVGILHLYLNWRTLWGYLRNRLVPGVFLKYELTAAVIILVGAMLGTYYEIPPFVQVTRWNEEIKDYWDRTSVRPPVPHAERISLDVLAGHLGIEVDKLLEALRTEGIAVENPSQQSIGALAAARGQSPSQLFAALAKHLPELNRPRKGPGRGQGRGQGRGRGRGFGRGQGGPAPGEDR